MEDLAYKMSQQYNLQLERIVFKKLMNIRSEALESGEVKVFQILNEIDFNNVAKTRVELEKSGYTFILELPEPDINFDRSNPDEILVSTSIKEEDVKIKILKVIFEA